MEGLKRRGARAAVRPEHQYGDKMKDAQEELNAQVARQSREQKKFTDKAYANAFATIQETRMMGGFCSRAKVIYPTIIR